MKVSELKGSELDTYVARARGWQLINDNPQAFDYWLRSERTDIDGFIYAKNYSPTTNNAQAFKLIEEFKISIRTCPEGWLAEIGAYSSNYVEGRGKILNTAICRAVVASKFGEEVSDA